MMFCRCTGPAFESNNQHEYGAPQVECFDIVYVQVMGIWFVPRRRSLVCPTCLLVTCVVAQIAELQVHWNQAHQHQIASLHRILSPAVTDDAWPNCGGGGAEFFRKRRGGMYSLVSLVCARQNAVM